MLTTQIFITTDNLCQYVAHLKSEERAATTVEKYIRDIRAFADFLNGTGIKKEAAILWKDKLKATHEATSVNSMITVVNGFFTFLGLDIKVKLLKIQRKTFLSSAKELTRHEYERLLVAAKSKNNERLYHIMQTICSTGIRVSELRFITVEAVHNGQAEVTNKNKTRTVFIPSSLKTVILRYAKQSGIITGLIFVTKNGKPIDRSNIWTDMRKLCESANVEPSKVYPHNLRHLFARTFYAKEKDIMKLADSLGHSDVNTTRIYVMGTGAEHRRIIESLGLVKLKYAT